MSRAVEYETFGRSVRLSMLRNVIVSTVVTPVWEQSYKLFRNEEFHFSDSLNSLAKMRLNPREVRLNQILENS